MGDPLAHERPRGVPKVSHALSRYFKLAVESNVESYMTDAKAGDVPQVVKWMITGNDEEFERKCLLNIRTILNKVTRGNETSIVAQVVDFLRETESYESDYNRIFTVVNVFDEIVDKACMENNFVELYTGLLYTLLLSFGGSEKNQTPLQSTFEKFLISVRRFDKDRFPELDGLRKEIPEAIDGKLTHKNISNCMTVFFRRYILVYLAEEIKHGKTHNTAFHVQETDSDDVRITKEQQRSVHLRNSVKFMASVFSRGQSLSKELITVTAFITCISYLLRRQYDRMLENAFQNPEERASYNTAVSEAFHLTSKQTKDDGSPQVLTITADDIYNETLAYQEKVRPLIDLLDLKYKPYWSTEYIELVIILLRTGGYAADALDRAKPGYTLYCYCMRLLEKFHKCEVIEARPYVQLMEIFEDRERGWPRARSELTLVVKSKIRPGRQPRPIRDENIDDVRELGLYYTLASSMGYLDSDINSGPSVIITDENISEWEKSFVELTKRIAVQNKLPLMVAETFKFASEQTALRQRLFYKLFVQALVEVYPKISNKDAQNAIVHALSGLLFQKHVKFINLFPNVIRRDQADSTKGYDGTVDEKQYELAVAVVRHCIERALESALEEDNYAFSPDQIETINEVYSPILKGKEPRHLTKEQQAKIDKIMFDIDFDLYRKVQEAGLKERIPDFVETCVLHVVAETIFQTNDPDRMLDRAYLDQACRVNNEVLNLYWKSRNLTKRRTPYPALEEFLVSDLRFPITLRYIIFARDEDKFESMSNLFIQAKMPHAFLRYIMYQLIKDANDRRDYLGEFKRRLSQFPLLKLPSVIISNLHTASQKISQTCEQPLSRLLAEATRQKYLDSESVEQWIISMAKRCFGPKLDAARLTSLYDAEMKRDPGPKASASESLSIVILPGNPDTGANTTAATTTTTNGNRTETRTPSHENHGSRRPRGGGPKDRPEYRQSVSGTTGSLSSFRRDSGKSSGQK
ncbi:hypothetical protein GMRT_21336 [Giardia muris]|uniref:Uncharacterized protein n=1 Tax=Giardia muris TaxID=5742 RepID=A0A4Z1T8Q1_GIAMU|nr:hypothetical protein GMRT_21336 [Giardia muris]|eukprot:TNJ30503.1 hypothetical protein GMRT_21336 [Giardia muris]